MATIREWFTMALERLRALAADVGKVSPSLEAAIVETEQILAGLSDVVQPGEGTGRPLRAGLATGDSKPTDRGQLKLIPRPPSGTESDRAKSDGKLTPQQRLNQELVQALLHGCGAKCKEVVRDLAATFDASKGISFLTTVYDTLASKQEYIRDFDFGKYITPYLGPQPHDGWHAHHILYKLGLGLGQQDMVRGAQPILREVGIHPVFGLEMFAWAPQRVELQHHIESLTEVVDALKKIKEKGGAYLDYVATLKRFGRIARKRQ
jgi:hypothetical protein